MKTTWTGDVQKIVSKLGKKFTLAEVYRFKNQLAKKHPENNNIEAKIRQQLQILRDEGKVVFVAPGVYKAKS